MRSKSNFSTEKNAKDDEEERSTKESFKSLPITKVSSPLRKTPPPLIKTPAPPQSPKKTYPKKKSPQILQCLMIIPMILLSPNKIKVIGEQPRFLKTSGKPNFLTFAYMNP